MHLQVSILVAVTLATMALSGGAKAAERFVLIAEEVNSQQTQSTRTEFDLVTERGEKYVVVRRYELLEAGGWKDVAVDDTCRANYNAPRGAIGRVRVVPPVEVNALAPICAPEPLFGALTDIVSFVDIAYDPTFRTAELKAAGESFALRGFSATWNRPPDLIEARIASERGQIRLESTKKNIKLVRWDPGPMKLTFERSLGGGRVARSQGIENILLEVRLDRRTGRLLSGRSIEDRLDLTMEIPGASRPVDVKIRRRLVLQPLRDRKPTRQKASGRSLMN